MIPPLQPQSRSPRQRRIWIGLLLLLIAVGVRAWNRFRSKPSVPLNAASRFDTNFWNLGEAGGHEAALELERMLAVPGLDPEDRADLLIARAMASTHDTVFALPYTNATAIPLRRTASLLMASTLAEETATRPTDTAAWQEALATGGDPRHGRRVFLSPQIGCARCHVAEGRGRSAGPDLSRIGTTQDRNQIIESILEPSKTVAAEHRAQEIETVDGDSIIGVQVRREAGEVIWLGADGRRMSLPEADVTRINELGSSLMPEGMGELLAVEEFRDLVTYLEGLGREE